jgi:hypothetical protein
MDAETALRRLSFVEASGSSAEAMVAMARHRRELAEARTAGERDEVTAAAFEAEAKTLRTVDKTA